MNKSLAATLALALVSAASLLPAQAETVQDGAKNAAMLPVKAASIGTGMVIGVPVAILRRTSNRCIEYTNQFADKVGGKNSGPAVIMASCAAFPFGMLVGTGEGAYYGSRNAVHGSVEKPFSLDSMSLGEMETSK